MEGGKSVLNFNNQNNKTISINFITFLCMQKNICLLYIHVFTHVFFTFKLIKTFYRLYNDPFCRTVSVFTLLTFSKASFILSGWTADRTNMRVTTSTLLSGTFSNKSSFVKSHWKAQQRSEQ